ncbi:MAG: ribosome silencing factor [Natronincolaceae bacterium]|jgi:ribosome-associated protein|nr:ribosome silencing factor [Bacillota bacterium]NLK91008.1 ribosome silencing factor [Clostridiales bacterium]
MENEIDNVIHRIYKAISKKAGEDTVILDLSKITSICDYFVITSAASSRQVKLIADEIQDELSEGNVGLLRKEGYDSGRWVLLDYGDIVIHIFHERDRKFYNIEGIWQDAGKVHIDID